jgi:transposase-like protein
MKNSRRKFSNEFKLKVISEAISEQASIKELGYKYDLQPAQIISWKKKFLEEQLKTPIEHHRKKSISEPSEYRINS